MTDKSLATKKPRITISLDPKIHKQLKDFCEYNSVPMSSFLENLANSYFEIDESKRAELEDWAKENRRSIHNQLQWIIEDALASRRNN